MHSPRIKVMERKEHSYVQPDSLFPPDWRLASAKPEMASEQRCADPTSPLPPAPSFAHCIVPYIDICINLEAECKEVSLAAHLVGEHGRLQVLERADEPAVGRLLPCCPGVPLQAGRGDAAEAREPQDLQVGHRQQVGGLHTRDAAAGAQEEELGRQRKEETNIVFILGARPPKPVLEVIEDRSDLPPPDCRQVPSSPEQGYGRTNRRFSMNL
jgi:hypothetical protein